MTWTHSDGSEPPEPSDAPEATAPSSRPRMANCANCGSEFERPANDITRCEGCRNTGIPDEKLERIEAIVSECEAEHGELAQRALSVVPNDRLRKDATREIRGSDGEYKSRVVAGVLKAFLRWLAEKQESQIVFEDPNDEEVTAPLEHSFDSEYMNRKYGIIKDGEEAFLVEAPNPHSVMLTLTGSNLNARGDPRAPGDHLRDLQESWDYVRRELQREMDRREFDRYDPEDTPERWWEYAVVLEPHESGYVHMHIAVFTSHSADSAAFEPVMDKHVETCEMAGSEAHSVENAVSVNRVDPETESMESVSNLGSYLAEYIGGSSGGESLWDEPVSKLIAYATIWATDTQRVRFSNGFHSLADRGRELRDAEPEGTSEDWSLAGIEDAEGERFDPHSKDVCTECGELLKDVPGDECPDCGGELKSRAADYTRLIRGVPGGDPPPRRS